MKIRRKIAIVTGASGGFGQAISKELVKKEFDLILTYNKNKKSILKLKKDLKIFNSNIYIIKADISNSNHRNKIFNAAKKYGVDILVNNAGINNVGEFEKITEKDWDKIMNINLKSTFFLSQGIFRIMKKNKFGHIVNISSGAALYHGPKTAHYAISKAGIISMTKLIARFGAPYNIMCNAIAPGIIETSLTKNEIKGEGGKNYLKMTLLKRFGDIKDVTNAVLYLTSNEQNYITGEVINITGGAYLG